MTRSCAALLLCSRFPALLSALRAARHGVRVLLGPLVRGKRLGRFPRRLKHDAERGLGHVRPQLGGLLRHMLKLTRIGFGVTHCHGRNCPTTRPTAVATPPSTSASANSCATIRRRLAPSAL